MLVLLGIGTKEHRVVGERRERRKKESRRDGEDEAEPVSGRTES